MAQIDLIGAEAPKALNRLAREQMKKRIMQDVLFDLSVCEIEGWDKREYINELRETLAQLGRKAGS